MPHIANLPEFLTPANNKIVSFYQLPSVNHAYNIGPITSLQIPRIVPINIILVPSIILFQLALLLFKLVLTAISPGHGNSNLAVTTNVQPVNPHLLYSYLL
jgi:hypothetical protein